MNIWRRDIGTHKFKQLREEVESILMTSGHCDPADLSPYLEKDNQDQLIMLKIILKLLHTPIAGHTAVTLRLLKLKLQGVT